MRADSFRVDIKVDTLHDRNGRAVLFRRPEGVWLFHPDEELRIRFEEQTTRRVREDLERTIFEDIPEAARTEVVAVKGKFPA